MKFINEDTRRAFHELTVDEQKHFINCDNEFLKRNLQLLILCVDGKEVAVSVQAVEPAESN